MQGAANALYAQRLGARRAFVVEHDDPYGRGLAGDVPRRRRAHRPAGRRQRALERAIARATGAIGERARAAGADTVFVAGDIAADGPKLLADLTAVLGPDVHFFAGDSFNLPEPLVEAAGSRVEGLRISIAVLPNTQLPPAGRRFAREFERRFSQRPCCFSVHDAQATHMLLDAIAESGGSRSRVSRARDEGARPRAA